MASAADRANAAGAEPGADRPPACIVCGEPATTTGMVTPARMKALGDGVNVPDRPEIKGPLCRKHKSAVIQGEGWQEERAKQRAADRERDKNAQMELG